MRAVHWKTAAVLAVAVWLPAHEATAQTGFNGVITFTDYESDGKQTTLIQTTKGHKVRFDGFGGSPTSMIMDGDAKVMMIVEPEKKQYMTMTEEDMKQMQAMTGQMMAKNKAMRHSDPAKYKISNTGRKETVAGVRCEVWRGVYLGDEEKEEGEACVAPGVGFALAEMTFANPMMQKGSAGYEQLEQFREMVGRNKGLLKMSTIKDGKSVTKMEATKIEPKTVSDDIFKPPAGYTELKMGEMMRQAQGAMKEMQEKAKPQGQPEQ